MRPSDFKVHRHGGHKRQVEEGDNLQASTQSICNPNESQPQLQPRIPPYTEVRTCIDASWSGMHQQHVAGASLYNLHQCWSS